MTETSRRSILLGVVSLISAPAIVRASSLMPVKVWRDPLFFEVEMTATEVAARLRVTHIPSLHVSTMFVEQYRRNIELLVGKGRFSLETKSPQPFLTEG